MVETGIEKAQKGQNANDEKKVMAGGIAITVVVILMIGWAVIFFHKIQNGSQQVQLNSGVPDQFNFTNPQEVQQQFQNAYGTANQDLQSQAANSQQQTVQQQVMQVGGSDTNQFTNPSSTN